jgi:hypothetical protein
MANPLPLPDHRPMLLTDQDGATAYAWFPPGTPTDPSHVLPARVYAEVCRLAGVEPSSPWVAFRDRSAALAAAVAANLAAG